jgi:hypothetical protein
MFTRTHHWTLFWARRIQSTRSHSVSLRRCLILSAANWSLPFRFPVWSIRTHVSHHATCLAHVIPLGSVVIIMFSEEYELEAPHCAVFSSCFPARRPGGPQETGPKAGAWFRASDLPSRSFPRTMIWKKFYSFDDALRSADFSVK